VEYGDSHVFSDLHWPETSSHAVVAGGGAKDKTSQKKNIVENGGSSWRL
jgi:hypothetical protein